MIASVIQIFYKKKIKKKKTIFKCLLKSQTFRENFSLYRWNLTKIRRNKKLLFLQILYTPKNI